MATPSAPCFHGTRWDAIETKGSGLAATKMPVDMLSTPDVNFRPVAMEVGPDGALYVSDDAGGFIYRIFYNNDQ